MTPPAPSAPEIHPAGFRLLVALLLAALLFSRLWGLEQQAFHHDESIHSLAIWNLARQGSEAYRYDPVYHGPLMYYWGAAFSRLLPDTDFTARLPFALAGVVLAAAALPLAAVAGRRVALLALALLVISPTVAYYSRFAREDVIMAALLAWVVSAGAMYLRTRRLRWLTVAWVCVVLGYCTKENSYINWFLVCSFPVVAGIVLVARDRRGGLRSVLGDYLPLTRLLVLFGLVCVALFVFVAVDVRVHPETPLWTGIGRIARHSVSLSHERGLAAASELFREEHGYFTSPGREHVRLAYWWGAAVLAVLLLAALEWIAAHARGAPLGIRVANLIASILGYSVAAWWLAGFVRWAAGPTGEWFLDDLRHRLVAGWLLLSGGALVLVLGVAVLRCGGRAGWRVMIRACRPALLAWWGFVIQLMVAPALYCVLFSSWGSNAAGGLRAGVYDYIAYWFRQQTGEYRIWGEWWYYLPRLLLYEFAALVLIALSAAILLRRKSGDTAGASRPLILFAAWLAAGMIAAYALLNEKVGWLAIYQAYALNLLAALLVGAWLHGRQRTPTRLLAASVGIVAIAFACWQHALAVHLHPDSPTEPMAFVTTSRGYKTEAKRVEQAHWSAIDQGAVAPLVALSGEGVWPAAWYLRRLRTTADPFAPDAAIRVLDDTAENRRRLKIGSGHSWDTRPAMVRGWWFAHGEGLPAGSSIAGNLLAAAINAPNDHRDAFPRDQAVPRGSRVGFAAQLWQFVLFRTPWYPSTGTPVIFAWQSGAKRDQPERVTWLEGFSREPREAAIVQRLAGAAQLRAPRAIAMLEDGRLAVADSGNGRVCILDVEGRIVRTFGEGILSRAETGPCGVAAGPHGLLYVTDTWNHAVRAFTLEGELVASCEWLPDLPGPVTWYGPRGIAVAGQGDALRVYVTDTGNNRIVVLDSNLQPVTAWGSPGSAPAQFDEPVGIVVDGEGWVHVADTGNARIQRFAPDGEYDREYPIFVPDPTERLSAEPQLALLPDGKRIAMTYATRGLFVVISPETGEAWPWKPSGEAFEPSGIAFSAEWDLYLADRRSGMILRLLEEGE